jgi:hypothetical protein
MGVPAVGCTSIEIIARLPRSLAQYRSRKGAATLGESRRSEKEDDGDNSRMLCVWVGARLNWDTRRDREKGEGRGNLKRTTATAWVSPPSCLWSTRQGPGQARPGSRYLSRAGWPGKVRVSESHFDQGNFCILIPASWVPTSRGAGRGKEGRPIPRRAPAACPNRSWGRRARPVCRHCGQGRSTGERGDWLNGRSTLTHFRQGNPHCQRPLPYS